MTDLEMMGLCAEAMGYSVVGVVGNAIRVRRPGKSMVSWNPIYHDEQAMALVKKMRLRVLPQFNGRWCADTGEVSVAKYYIVGEGDSPNHAIVIAAAKMQKENV